MVENIGLGLTVSWLRRGSGSGACMLNVCWECGPRPNLLIVVDTEHALFEDIYCSNGKQQGKERLHAQCEEYIDSLGRGIIHTIRMRLHNRKFMATHCSGIYVSIRCIYSPAEVTPHTCECWPVFSGKPQATSYGKLFERLPLIEMFMCSRLEFNKI